MARYAAVDIGSNSVRMLAAEVLPGLPTRALAADREVTRLGTSVFNTGRVSTEATDLVCSVLRRMAAAYSKLDLLAVRAVATSAIRDASNQAEFIDRASEALGTPVEIISGQEEARLIHLGVQSRWPHPEERILIIDVGGGSVEFIVADRGEIREGISRQLGAVRLTEVFLKHDPPTRLELHRMEQFIDEKFEPALHRIENGSFHRVIATSATAAAIVSAINAVPRSDREAADRMKAEVSQIRDLYSEVSTMDLGARRKVAGIGPRRAEIIIAGSAVFLRVLESLRLDSLYYSVAGVRDGIIEDLDARGVGRYLSRLSPMHVRVVESMCAKYGVDLPYARQVSDFAVQLFDALQPLHRLPRDHGRLLQTAAFLLDSGHFISDTGHHKHSAYIVANSDLPGYTDQERELVAILCRYHRKSLPTTRHEQFRALPPESRKAVQMLTPLLRIAVALETSKEQRISKIECQLNGAGATLSLSGEKDFDLEVWAAERGADIFRQVYGVPMTIVRAQQ
jgi:exopolyphosphatase/guanosine-5'-triphosphate,3'-diphosphate pyrophosphatase